MRSRAPPAGASEINFSQRLHAAAMRRAWLAKVLVGPLIFLILALAPPLPLVPEAAAAVRAPHAKAPQVALGALFWVASWWVL